LPLPVEGLAHGVFKGWRAADVELARDEERFCRAVLAQLELQEVTRHRQASVPVLLHCPSSGERLAAALQGVPHVCQAGAPAGAVQWARRLFDGSASNIGTASAGG